MEFFLPYFCDFLAKDMAYVRHGMQSSIVQWKLNEGISYVLTRFICSESVYMNSLYVPNRFIYTDSVRSESEPQPSESVIIQY